jgi:uncharacterized protein (DUF3084 family)
MVNSQSGLHHGTFDAMKQLLRPHRLLLFTEEERVRQKAGEICIAEQNLRSLNEKMFFLHESYTEQEKRQQELLSELVEVQWKITKTGEEVQKRKKELEVNLETQKIFAERVQAAEVSRSVGNDPKYIAIKAEVDNLLDLSKQLVYLYLISFMINDSNFLQH